MKKTNQWFLVLFISTLLALATHSYLSVQHFDLKLGLSSGPSVCNISESFNCDRVASSNYSEILGVSVALLGLFFQLAILILAVAARFELSSHTPLLRRGILWLSLLAAVVSLVMGFISSIIIQAHCLFCMLTYACSFVGLFAAYKISQTDGPAQALPSDIKALFGSAKWVLVILFLVPALAFVAQGVMLNSYGFGKLKLQIQHSVSDWSVAGVQSFKSEEGLVLYNGSGEPKMTIVEFADFLCPHCKVAATTLENFVKARKDVKLIFKAFPLDGKCNKAISQQGNGLRCQLAGAVICSENLFKKGWEAHHWIFANQEGLSSKADWKVIEDLSTALKVDLAELKNCLTLDATLETISSRAKEGENAKIEGTPAIFVNGKRLQNGQFPPFLKAVYDGL
jgi:protein-disulfide isomerase/uncharacterized membrane protein